jgi:tetratricopeptide (TPR) repeat protein
MMQKAFQIQGSKIQRLILPMLAAGVMLSATPALAQYSQEAVHQYNQGIEAYSQGHTAEALKHFNKAVQVDPGYGDAYYNMGSIYYQSKQYAEASDMFHKSVRMSPTDSQAKYNLALTLEKLQRYDEAVSVLGKIPATDPKYSQARMKMDELRPALKPQSTGATTPALVKPAPATSMADKQKPLVNPAKPATPASPKLATQLFSKGYDGPTGIAIGPGGFMYVANYSKNTIYRVGAGGEKTIFAQGEGLKGPIGLIYNPKVNELYVANYLLGNVSRINATGKVSALVSGLNKPYNLFLDTVNNTLYISEQDPANQISRVMLPNTP